MKIYALSILSLLLFSRPFKVTSELSNDQMRSINTNELAGGHPISHENGLEPLGTSYATISTIESVDDGYDYFGDSVNVADTTNVNRLLSQLEGGRDSIYATFAAPIRSVCQVKGCWMTVDLGNGNEALVKFKDYAFFVPMDAESELAIIEGGLTKEVLSVEWLRHQAEDAGKSKSEILKINEPQTSYFVLASGVALAVKQTAYK